MCEKAKLYYENGIWTKEMLWKLVSKGKLTKAEYDKIVLS